MYNTSIKARPEPQVVFPFIRRLLLSFQSSYSTITIARNGNLLANPHPSIPPPASLLKTIPATPPQSVPERPTATAEAHSSLSRSNAQPPDFGRLFGRPVKRATAPLRTLSHGDRALMVVTFGGVQLHVPAAQAQGYGAGNLIHEVGCMKDGIQTKRKDHGQGALKASFICARREPVFPAGLPFLLGFVFFFLLSSLRHVESSFVFAIVPIRSFAAASRSVI